MTTRHQLCVALAGAMLAAPALADDAKTKGGFEIVSADERFSATLGGRIHFDGNLVDGEPGAASDDDLSDFFFRRARLTLKGEAYGWSYKFEQDFAGDTVDAQDLYVSTGVGPGKVTIGQFLVERSLQEQTSSNSIVFMERAVVSGKLLGNTQRGVGLGYSGHGVNYSYGVAAQNRKDDEDGNNSSDGWVTSGRYTVAPVMTDDTIVHLGISGSLENLNNSQDTATAETGRSRFQYAGRNVGSVDLATGYDEAAYLGLELAGTLGSLAVQAEYAQGDLDILGGGSQDVVGYYAQASYFLTGERRVYSVKKGSFSAPKPIAPGGAWEIKARYEFAQNDDSATMPEISATTIGTNWYVNPNVRFMLDYIIGDRQEGRVTVDEPKVLTARAQFVF